MEDEYQITLKGKIKILYQLEKWQDVIILCEEYNGAYGEDIEVDMICYKSEQRLNKTASAAKKQVPIVTPESNAPKSQKLTDVPKIEAEEEPVLLLPADHETVQNPAMLVMNEIPSANQPLLVEENPDDEPIPGANELIIIDPFAENEPVFNLANNEPPVILIDSGKAENVQIQTEPQAEEISIDEEKPNEFVGTKNTFDFKSNPAIAFDADPSLTTPPPQGESIAMQINDEEKKLPAESLAPDSAADAEPADALEETSVSTVKEIAVKTKVESAALATDSFIEMVKEKPQSMSEPYDNFSKKTKSPKKTSFNFKYLLVLILPLAAAVILLLALSGKLNFDGGAAEKVSPASVVEPPVPVVQKPIQKVPPVVQTPQIDEKDQLLNAKILQANIFIKNGDMLNALTVVLEAKKIKMTEPLRLLEELITKKIREDEARAVEQQQTVQSVVQSEDQVYAKAENENTLAAWQNFLLLYPQGEFVARARKKIVALEKKVAQKAEQEFQLKIQQAQKLILRSDYMNLSQAELNTALQQLGKPSVQFEQLERGGEKIIIDFSSGLMWTLWKKPMGFDKAKWWANRIYAGYSGWRLPTVDESQSLLQMDKTLYANLADFAVWTGDAVSDKTRSIWTLRLPQGQFIGQDYDQVYYVWAVRKAGK